MSGALIRAPEKIATIRVPVFPQFRFEWHPGVRKVYLVHVGAVPEVGTSIADEVDTHGAAINAVHIYLRGYKAAKAELAFATPERK